jgi:hypothetical protein
VSGRGNEEFVAKYMTDAEAKKYVLMENTVTGYRIGPEFDANGHITGSRIDYCTSVVDNGNIPKWVIDTMMPSSALEGVDNLIKFCGKSNQ